MKEKIKKKIVWDDSGVSEILGDILILVMTVMLFASVFLFVWTMPAPDEDVYANFEPAMQLTESGALIDITHTGGETLLGVHTVIYVFKNIDEEIRALATQGTDGDNPSYGIKGDSDWDSGENWEYNFLGISTGDDIRISIVDARSGRQVLRAQLLGNGYATPPIIMQRWYNPEPAVNQSVVTVSARVMDPQGKWDVDQVYFNATKLNKELAEVEMLNEDGDQVYTALILLDCKPGDYELTIIAVDSQGLEDRARLSLSVIETARPIFEYVTISPNSVEIETGFAVRCAVIDLNYDLDLANLSITAEEAFFSKGGTLNTNLELADEIPCGGTFETMGTAPGTEGEYQLTLKATDYEGHITSKQIMLAVLEDDSGAGNGSFNDSIWAFIGPESLDFKKFYYTTDNPPLENTTYHLAVFVNKTHIGNDCYFHINVINHYYEDVFIDGNSRIRLLQIGGAASNKDLSIVQNETDFGDPVGTSPDGTWYKIPKSETGDYFHGGAPVSLVFGPFNLQSAKKGDVFGSIMVLTGSYGEESLEPEKRMGQTLPFQALVVT